MSRPAVLRLNKHRREMLSKYARQVVVFEDEQAAESAAFHRVRTAVIEAVDASATRDEFEVLRKFGAVHTVTKASFRNPEATDRYDTLVTFFLSPRDVHAPPTTSWSGHREVPEEWQIQIPYHLGIHRTGGVVFPEATDAEIWPLFAAWQAAVAAHDAVRREALSALFALFREKTTLKAVVSVWPAAKNIAASLGYIPPPTDESIAKIREIKVRTLPGEETA